jgi:hypothetical protein
LVGLAVATLFLLNSEAVGAVVFFAVAMGYLPFVVDWPMFDQWCIVSSK